MPQKPREFGPGRVAQRLSAKVFAIPCDVDKVRVMSDDTHYCGVHLSHETLSEITSSGEFGGVFAAANGGMAGKVKHHVYSPRHLSNYDLNYDSELDAYSVALYLCDGDESTADAIMNPGCPDGGDADRGWELQKLRGALAARLGYTSVEMSDENGHSTLCLPGCVIVAATE